MNLTQKETRAMFRAIARAALEVEALLDDDLRGVEGHSTSAASDAYLRLNTALRQVACTSLGPKLPALKAGTQY